MCEITKEPCEADKPQLLEIAAVPKRRTWYGVVGAHPECLVPGHLTENAEVAKARALIQNTEYPVLGPWHVVVLTENLRVPG